MNENGWVKGLVIREIAFALLALFLGLAIDTVSAGVPHAVIQVVMSKMF